MLPNMTAKSADPKVIAAIRGIMESCPAITIEHALAAMRDREDHVDFLPSISEPSLILVGTDDAITPVASAQMMQGKISRSKLVTIAGAGHTSPMEKPAEVSRAIEEFVASIA
jgi:3-oxoadipate enol-lactonase